MALGILSGTVLMLAALVGLLVYAGRRGLLCEQNGTGTRKPASRQNRTERQ